MFFKVHSTVPCKFWDGFQISLERKSLIATLIRLPILFLQRSSNLLYLTHDFKQSYLHKIVCHFYLNFDGNQSNMINKGKWTVAKWTNPRRKVSITQREAAVLNFFLTWNLRNFKNKPKAESFKRISFGVLKNCKLFETNICVQNPPKSNWKQN